MTPSLVCLALTVYFEAQDQPLVGQVAVAQVVMERVEHSRFPNSVCEVVKQGGEFSRYQCHFSWWCDGKSDAPRDVRAWDRAMRVAGAVMNGGVRHVPLIGVTHYHAHYVDPWWAKSMKIIGRIGQHVFYVEA